MRERKSIAIIGTGISGLTCGYLLKKDYDITFFEANDYIGGHTHTVDLEVENEPFAIDTGFIVFNDWTYPNFQKLLQQLAIKAQPTEMSFSVHNESSGLEYNGNNLNSLFAQRRNLLSPKFYFFIGEILRFNKVCKLTLALKGSEMQMGLFDFLERHNFNPFFSYNYILPMCAAIWSTSLNDIKQFPLAFFLNFFNNHGLLNIVDRPQWYTLMGGSKSYIPALIQGLEHRIHLNTPVKNITRNEQSIALETHDGWQHFDEVIFACHSDESLAILADPTPAEVQTLGDITYSKNYVVLHSDVKMLPKRKLAWASWNYHLSDDKKNDLKPASVTYNMNILQRIESKTTFCVTLNPTSVIAEDKIFGRYQYHHPVFDSKSLKAQQQRAKICGVNHTHFCGAYWYNGFHEDGVKSALDVCARFGARLDA